MRDSHFCEMRWYSEISNAAFCESLELRRILLQKRQLLGSGKQRSPPLEPASAEFISALAAGINSRHTLQVGCGLSTLALAAAARATNSCLLSVHDEAEKQDVVRYFLREMELDDYVEFITEDPSTFIPKREGLEFVLFSGQPDRYIELFDLLKLKKGAIVVADNALDDTTNDYMRHVRRQPGVESSTLPLGRGIEVTKIITWEAFNRGRKIFEGDEDLHNDKDSMRRPCLQGVVPATRSSPCFSACNGDASSHTSDVDAERDHNQSEPPSSTGTSVHNGWPYRSGYVMPIVDDSEDHLEIPQNEVFEQQFKSIQSLAEKWRKQLAALSTSSGSSVEESVPLLPEVMQDEPLSHLDTQQSMTLPHYEAPGDQKPKSPQKATCLKDLLSSLVVLLYGIVQCCSQKMVHLFLLVFEIDFRTNLETSLSPRDASIAEKVAPEPLDSTEFVLSTEGTVIDFEEPGFQVSFQVDNGQTEVTVMGAEQEMLLFDITFAFNETGVSVKRAKISTQVAGVMDIFYVVDGETNGPLSEAHEEEVRKRILERLAERRQALVNQKVKLI
ncbi:uncharacterized protein [Physcomitrium patens]|uniref:ACT domain-containing protein n=1 Tax=Physcomitrium patens TaxID=3218 RepID=A0A7I4DH39_PHYPA|nr:uncharacterized protein LOC112281834 isoform X3 [Physcomitrium patens]|eukprot:XP_024374536.1 uncharacterized protein LOC112281834 isoform X3 [Physcomitrella patens]